MQDIKINIEYITKIQKIILKWYFLKKKVLMALSSRFKFII